MKLVLFFPTFLQGLGLFAARDLEKHTMVIEYIGELIRNEVAEKREKQYEEQVRGTLTLISGVTMGVTSSP